MLDNEETLLLALRARMNLTQDSKETIKIYGVIAGAAQFCNPAVLDGSAGCNALGGNDRKMDLPMGLPWEPQNNHA
jgi:hypothetical protein